MPMTLTAGGDARGAPKRLAENRESFGAARRQAPPLMALLTMFASWPTTGPALSGGKIFARHSEPLASRLSLLGVLDPADPLITRERRDILPVRPRRGVRNEHFSQICRYAVHNARRKFCFSHASILTHTGYRGRHGGRWQSLCFAEGGMRRSMSVIWILSQTPCHQKQCC